MNERIRELYDQSIVVRNNDAQWIFEGDLDPEKFAQLIVRECVSIGDNYQDILGDEPECFNCRKVAYGIVDKIKQQFGVEE